MMLLSRFRNYVPMIVGGAVTAACVLAGATILGSRSIDSLIETSAQTRASTFADYLLTDRTRLDALLVRMARDPDLETDIRTVAALSHISGFTVFDETGRETFTTRAHEHEWLLRDRPGGLSGGSRLSGETLAREAEWIDMLGSGPSRPTVVMPLLRDGRTVAYLSTELDMAAERFGHTRVLAYASLQFVSIFLLAIGAPTLFYVRRKRRVQEADERIRFLHNHDALTNLLNRRHMHEETDRRLAHQRATRERTALWFADIEGLTDINDTLGQTCGDEMLQIVAGRLKEAVGRNDLLSRIGADDFAILQRDLRNGDEDLRVFAHALLRDVCKPVELAGQTIVPRLALGVALAPDHGRTYAQLVRHAELAFCHQKSHRRGEYTRFEPWMDEEAHRRRTIEQMLRSAIETGGFELFYQPIVSGADERLLGFEALIRMPDGEGGYVPPAAFIPVAEAKGYIKPIGTWVIREAIRQAGQWPDDLFVSLNLSAVQFRDDDLLPIVEGALRTNGVEGRRIGIEVVESLLMDQSDEILDQLQRLRALGISVDMDDFGTGYSSLGYLWRFPFDKLKIDQSFVKAFQDGRAGASHILATIVTLAHRLGLKVTAEGVETREQADLLRSLGCDQLQGYHFGRPRPPAELHGDILASVPPRPASPAASSASDRGHGRLAGSGSGSALAIA